MIIFVDWKDGPRAYLRVSPYIWYFMMLSIYVIFPLVNFGYGFIVIFLPNSAILDCIYYPWIIFYNVVQLGKLYTYITRVRQIYFYNALLEW